MRWVCALLLTMALPTWAQEVLVSETLAVSETAPRDAVRAAPTREGVLRLLDKQTNQVQQLPMVLESTLTPLPDVQVTMRKCVRDYRGMRGLDVAWVEVRVTGSEGYDGWIFNWYPDAAGLEHPRYDVRLVQCGTLDTKRRLTPATVGGVVVRGVDAPTAPDEEAPQEAPVVEGVPDTSVVLDTVNAPAVEAAVEPQAEETPVTEEVPAPEAAVVDDNGDAAPVAPAAQGGEDPFFVPGLDDQQQLRQLMEGQ